MPTSSEKLAQSLEMLQTFDRGAKSIFAQRLYSNGNSRVFQRELLIYLFPRGKCYA